MTGYAFSVALGFMFSPLIARLWSFVLIVCSSAAVLEEALHCVRYTAKATSVQVCIGLGYINCMLA